MTRKADGILPPLVQVQPSDKTGGRSWATKPKMRSGGFHYDDKKARKMQNPKA